MFNFLPLALAFAGSLGLFFTAPQQSLPVGREFKVAVLVASENRTTLGTDAVLTFDPRILKVVKIVPGKIYPLYPQNLQEIDNIHGKLSFSGTVGFNKPQTANGVLGTVYFRSKKEGSTILGFSWMPNTTNDSNLVPDFGGIDLLAEKPPDAYLTFRKASFWEKILIKLQWLFSFEYLQF